jgi:hypothetical protein
MESQKIHTLLQKYFDAETTLDEENELITYFASGEVDESLKMYVPMFSGLKELSADENADLSDDLMNYILESEHKEKLHYRWMWQIVTGIAAAVIVALLAVNFYGSRNDYKDTFSDPQQAYTEAVKTLHFVSGKYNKGLAQLKPMGKIDNAVSPLKSGISKVNKGFKQIDEVTNLNKKLKKE